MALFFFIILRELILFAQRLYHHEDEHHRILYCRVLVTSSLAFRANSDLFFKCCKENFQTISITKEKLKENRNAEKDKRMNVLKQSFSLKYWPV